MYTKPRHRHLVALPVALGMLCMAFVPWQEFSARAALLETDGQIVSLGVHARAQFADAVQWKRGEDDLVALEAGSALIDSPGLVTLHASPYTLKAWGGAFHVTRSANRLSIAALNTPVLARDGQRTMLIPAGMQWRTKIADALPTVEAGWSLWADARTVQPIPHDFLAEKLRERAYFTSREAAGLAKVQQPVLSPFAVLPSARKQVADAESLQAIDLLHTAIAFNDVQGIADTLALFDHATAPASIHEEIASLTQGTSTGIRALLSAWLLQDTDNWMLASVHPQLSSEAWTHVAPELSQDELALVLSKVPVAEVHPTGLHVLARERWNDMLAYFIESVHESDAFLDMIVSDAVPVLTVMHQQEYPLRFDFYASALKESIARHDGQHVPDTHKLLAVLDALTAVKTVSLPEEVVEEVQAEEVEVAQEPAKPETILAGEEVLYRAEVILRDARALYTAETDVRPAADPNTVVVEDVIFSTPSQDRILSFHLDVLQGRIFNVSEGNREYAFPLWVEDFVDWVNS